MIVLKRIFKNHATQCTTCKHHVNTEHFLGQLYHILAKIFWLFNSRVLKLGNQPQFKQHLCHTMAAPKAESHLHAFVEGAMQI